MSILPSEIWLEVVKQSDWQSKLQLNAASRQLYALTRPSTLELLEFGPSCLKASALPQLLLQAALCSHVYTVIWDIDGEECAYELVPRCAALSQKNLSLFQALLHSVVLAALPALHYLRVDSSGFSSSAWSPVMLRSLHHTPFAQLKILDATLPLTSPFLALIGQMSALSHLAFCEVEEGEQIGLMEPLRLHPSTRLVKLEIQGGFEGDGDDWIADFISTSLEIGRCDLIQLAVNLQGRGLNASRIRNLFPCWFPQLAFLCLGQLHYTLDQGQFAKIFASTPHLTALQVQHCPAIDSVQTLDGLQPLVAGLAMTSVVHLLQRLTIDSTTPFSSLAQIQNLLTAFEKAQLACFVMVLNLPTDLSALEGSETEVQKQMEGELGRRLEGCHQKMLECVRSVVEIYDPYCCSVVFRSAGLSQ